MSAQQIPSFHWGRATKHTLIISVLVQHHLHLTKSHLGLQ